MPGFQCYHVLFWMVLYLPLILLPLPRLTGLAITMLSLILRAADQTQQGGPHPIAKSFSSKHIVAL